MPTKPDINGVLYLCLEVQPEKFLLMGSEDASVLGAVGRRFWLLDADGNVLAEYGPDFACDGECSFYTIYEMRDGTLFKYSGKDDDTSSSRLCNWEAEIVCNAYRKLPRDDERAARIFSRLRDLS